MEINLTKQEIDKINKIFSNIIDESELKKIKSKRSKLLDVGNSFIVCFDHFQNNLFLLEDDEKNKLRTILEYFENKEFSMNEIRNILDEYDPEIPGSYLLENKIKNILSSKRKEINELISLFIKCFDEGGMF